VIAAILLLAFAQQQDMRTIHALFDSHARIQRTVKNIPGGVEAVTESEDKAVRDLIVEHTWAMKSRLEKKQVIRGWDPLFRALFEHSEKIKLDVTPTAKGVKVIETSADPYVVKLIQSHAAGVSEFTAQGLAVMHKEHPLPNATPKSEAEFEGKGDGVKTCPVTGEPVNKDIHAEINGRKVFFCCESCRAAAVANPKKYVK
jgi:YHS domain-containing protein